MFDKQSSYEIWSIERKGRGLNFVTRSVGRGKNKRILPGHNISSTQKKTNQLRLTKCWHVVHLQLLGDDKTFLPSYWRYQYDGDDIVPREIK